MFSRIIFLGSSRIIEPSVLWLKDTNLPFLVFTNAEQAKKCSFLNQLSDSEIVVADDIQTLLIYPWQGEDIAISVGAPWLFRDSFFKSFVGRAFLNLHGSQLPLYRGGNLFSWFVLNNVRVGMSLLHHVSPIMDEGPIAYYDEFLYPGNCKRPIDYIRSYEKNNSSFLLNTLKKVVQLNEPIPQNHQPHYLSSYWPRLKSDVNGWIDWNLDGILLERFISAFDEPYGGAYTSWRQKEIRLKEVFFQPGFNHHPYQYGIIFRNNGKWMNIAVQGGELIVCSVIIDNKPADLSLFRPGDRFLTPSEKIDTGKKRIIRTDTGLSIQADIES